MSRRLPFRLLNVFATDDVFSGNALCVFEGVLEDGSFLDDETMAALARQTNLAETTFIFPSERATARVRIFTPTREMPFAGHPTLGTAHVIRALRETGDAMTLEMRAGVIPVTAQGDLWTLRANPPRSRAPEATSAALEGALGLMDGDVAREPAWIDTGTEQLIVPLSSAEAVEACEPDVRLLDRLVSSPQGETGVYVFAREEGEERIVARFFYVERSAVLEDPGTGSACANLGGWFVLRGGGGPRAITITQGERTGRTCRLGLRVSAEGEIFVTGRVVPIGEGELVV